MCENFKFCCLKKELFFPVIGMGLCPTLYLLEASRSNLESGVFNPSSDCYPFVCMWMYVYPLVLAGGDFCPL